MKKIIVILSVCATMSLGFSGCGSASEIMKGVEQVLGGTSTAGGGKVSTSQIIMGLKQALEIGVGNGATTVSKADGFLKNPAIKIPFPKDAIKVANTMRDLGLNKQVDNAVASLNRAAEDAAKSAKPIFIKAITSMTITDAMGILKGTPNAATDYLKRTTTNELLNAFSPVVGRSLDKVNATKIWGDVINTYNKVPMTKKVNTDLKGYVTGKAVDGLFFMVAKEEAKIRKDPLKRTTALLKKVFKLQDS